MNIQEYKKKFYTLLESDFGDVRPLLNEDEPVKTGNEESSSEETSNQNIIQNLGLDLSTEQTEDGVKALYACSKLNICSGNVFIDGDVNGEFTIRLSKINTNIQKSLIPQSTISIICDNSYTSAEDIKKYVGFIQNGFPETELFNNNPAFSVLYDYFNNQNLSDYVGNLWVRVIDLSSPTTKGIDVRLVFRSTTNKVKSFMTKIGLPQNEVLISLDGSKYFEKEFTIQNNQISFEKDRKSTKSTNSTDANDINSLYQKNVHYKQGAVGSAVKEIQYKLLNSNLTGTYKITNDIEGCKNDVEKCDGRFGGETKKAVKEFQLNNELVDDGIVGPDTLSALYSFEQE